MLDDLLLATTQLTPENSDVQCAHGCSPIPHYEGVQKLKGAAILAFGHHYRHIASAVLICHPVYLSPEAQEQFVI